MNIDASLLTSAIAIAVLVDWAVAFLLIRLSRRQPLIVSLNERATLAALLALFGTVYLVAAANADAGFALAAAETFRVIVRFALLVLTLYPVRWLYLYLRGGFR